MTMKEEPHPDPGQLRAMARGQRTPAADRRHVAQCRKCAEDLELLRVASASLAAREECPDAALLVSLHDEAGLGAGEAERIERHVHACPACLDLMEGLERAHGRLKHLPGPGKRGVGSTVDELLRRLRGLVSFTMPEPLALATRGAAVAGGEAWKTGMTLYRDQRWADAGQALDEALAAGGRAPELHFFLGVCQLKEGHIDEAVHSLDRAVKRNARLGEYRWYLAQALLQAGRGAEALAQLDRARRLPGRYRDEAGELATRLRAILEAS